MTLLDHVRALVEAEQGLTAAIEQSRPLLAPRDASSSSSVLLSSADQSAPPLLPTPRNMDEVQDVLAVARAYSLRTSAPPMWNPNLPVIGFATPNPLPHQLRGGALGAMQLKMAREEKNRRGRELADRREKERRRLKEDKKLAETKGGEEGDAMDVDKDEAVGKRKREEEDKAVGNDPKKREAMEHQKLQVSKQPKAPPNKRQTAEEYQKKKKAANMNLSESSSSEESSGEEESD
ncbi:hypothetical protein ACHAXT_004168 [Thalassiosira profunda]